MDIFRNKVVLVTGGTGSFGQGFVKTLLLDHEPEAVRVFSRDEVKQWEMNKCVGGDDRVRFFLGDVRDRDRLELAMDGVDVVVHAAALKQVPLCEYNPFEAVKTNILGSQNVVKVALNHNVDKVMSLSTDKAVSPTNLYGATKMCMERLFVAGNSYVGDKQTKISCVRYGNVIGSRGSVIPVFKEQRETGTVTITDERMTRFWITLNQSVRFVIDSIERMLGGEIFIPKIPSTKITDLVKAIAPECGIKVIGIRPGEKLHECLLTKDEARHAREFKKFFVIEPEHRFWEEHQIAGNPLPDGFTYTSDGNTEWLTTERIQELLGGI
ncbi:MAG: UDP-N-acetylglucosamine 4,6-dehydratase (inverting) [Epsilonproteobacteria bacterium]|nr:MAG: UDP-N-acetylglucosamine 4,6-dehydratase (inverting) [Campylobacterota bacterium]